MPTEEVHRKLAAILSADVVGYSRLMAEDEAGTIRMLTDYREVIATLIRQHRGRMVDSPGDNLLAEFPTALDAVQGAVEIQRVIQARNADLPTDRRMEFRIGIHLGDVTVESERIYGDGVNIAARLEGLAKAGGVCISATVYEQVERKLNVDLEDLGEQTLKNIAKPVHVYGMKLVLPGAERGEPEPALPGMDELTVPGFGGRPALAVLPFENLSGDPDQEYFADGIAEDLITRLSAFRSFPVIARNSSFVYKGKPVDVKQVSRELGVRYLLEGSVRKAADRVRISAQLIDATTGAHVWAQRYDRELRDIFALQDEISEAIAASMHPELSQFERQRAARREPENLDAWECLSRAWWHFERTTKEDVSKARRLFQRATELDPHSSEAYAGLARAHGQAVIFSWTDAPAQSIREADLAARRSVELDPNNAAGQIALGIAYWLTGQSENGLAAARRATELNPNDSHAYSHLGLLLAVAGYAEEALKSLEKAMRLSPRDPAMWLFLWALAVAHFAGERYEEAVESAKHSLRANPRWPATWTYLAASYAQLGRIEEARTAVEESLRLQPEASLSMLRSLYVGADSALVERFFDTLRKAGYPE